MPKETFLNLSEEKQEKVMRAAIHEFLTYGFERGNVGAIAKQAGIAKGSIYQYFDDKKEILLHSVRWSLELLMKKYSHFMPFQSNNGGFFEMINVTLDHAWIQVKEEHEIALFLQEVLLGTFNPVAAETRDTMRVASELVLLKLIKDGQTNGYFRKDIDDHMLVLFLSGATFRFKEYFLNQVKESGKELSDEHLEKYKSELKSLYALILNGMGVK
ncbi:TetR/AcrR family transcriptional regulator [Paenibacillus sp. NEAU-GSW1]|uniref:TetR/AcrR family transcriptional regulator n=1 Tax=Paenibacillus sp. NEAU-GSW1 TaxID=2682486 RepID=UPI0012E28724|nr:TetR/AcrR family transcriptional regulator [Paenibacillus sp. NEAU-GSW1]MUT68332.1 TetR family transcriptional regulator [Paenibacillus sp. NEAU-GSW1]